jgi:nucleotide-binding universal stress UspA family protein
METVLVATDGSPTAACALEFAIALCRKSGARLEVLTVRTLAQHGDSDAPCGDHMDVQPVVERIAAEAAESARALGVDATWHTAYGSPAAVIQEAAEELAADLVIVGSHGRSRLKRAVLGSVSKRLASSCSIPVTIVRSPVTEPRPSKRGSTVLRSVPGFGASLREEAVARYVICEAKKGRDFSSIVDDAYIQNRADRVTLEALLDRGDIVESLGANAVDNLRARVASYT